MLQNFLAVIFVVGLLAREGISQQCYSQRDCVSGSEIDTPADPPTLKACCVGTNDGQSFNDSGGTCTNCVVHGFLNTSYNVNEEDFLDTMFQLNVKGTTSFPLIILGTITSEAGTAGPSDFEMFQPITVVDNMVDNIRLFTTNDEVTLEYDDTVILRFTPDSDRLIPGVEGVGEFIRDTATVHIIDNDRLEINIEESDYSIEEGAANPMIRLQFRRTQSSFTMTIFPVSIVDLNQRFSFNVEDFITIPVIPEALATAGDDFTSVPFIITIPSTEDRPPGPISEDIQQNDPVPRFRVIDDDVNEIEQSFALVAVLGDVPDNFVCFQRQVGDTECFGRTGATEIKIVDNDAMIIGFSERRQHVSESDAPPGIDRFPRFLTVHSLRRSELNYEVLFRVLETGNATVEAFNVQFETRFDALFGVTEDEQAPIVDRETLEAGSLELSRMILTQIVNDFVPEDPQKCYEVRILSPDITTGPRIIFTCNEDEDSPADYFCIHTICIWDDDEPFEVAYVQTTYTVIESGGQVEVCVNLTKPDFDILEETIRVESFNDENSMYIPPGAVLATPDPPNFLGMYDMVPKSDYEEQIRGINRIRDIVINATRRLICYNLPIYDDMRLEMMEYAGLTLDIRDSSVLTLIRPLYDQMAIKILDDDNAVVCLEETFCRVPEDVGVVEVCAIVCSPNITCPIEFPFNVNLTTSDGSAVASMDYEPLSTLLMFDIGDTRQCTNITIKDDTVLENTESFFVNLLRTPDLDPRITLDPVLKEIEITDNDDAVVGLERTFYNVSEDVGVVEVCAIVYRPDGSIPCPIDFAFDVSLSTRDDSAVSPFDYIAVDTILMFDACQMRSCVDVTIVDDEILENVESFDLTLERTSGLDSRITLDPVNGVVEIIDNDEAVVGLERTFYEVSELVGVVEVCTIVHMPAGVVCPIQFPFDVMFSTIDSTAVATMDYGSVSMILRFATCQRRECVNITIENDGVAEPLESFFVTLERTPDLDGRIALDPVDGEIVIIDVTEAVVGLERTFHQVSEDVGVVELCAIVYEPDSTVPCPISFPFNVSLSTFDSTAVAPMDYIVVDTILMFGACERRRCVDVTIVDDEILEGPEFFGYTLERTPGLDSSIELNPVLGRVEIIDDDEAVVGLERTFYQVSEGVGVVEVCAIVYSPSGICPIAIPFDVALSTQDGTGQNRAVTPMDYGAVSTILMFAACDTRQCVDVPIMDDETLELTEFFIVTLERTPALENRITLNPVDGVIEILDNDGPAVVGLERTFYQVSEDVGVVEVCAIVYSPDIACPIQFPFDVRLSTLDGSAMSPMDYDSISEILAFGSCETRQCTEIPIVDDMIVELTESFFVTLERTPGLDSRITLDPVDGEIEITDDDEAVVGLERTSYTVPESVGVVEVCTIVYSPDLPCPIDHPFNVRFSTDDGTAVSPMDYGAVSTILMFDACDTRRCVDVTIVNDGDDEPDEMFGITLERIPGLNDRITLNPVDGNITIIDDDVPVTVPVKVNDTLTGDPLMTVPIHTDPNVMEGDVITSLCYEVHGEADKFFNLVSDSCVSVNSHYSRAGINNPNITLNIVDAIGVRAVSNNGTCLNIRVGLDGCEVTINGAAIRGRMYRSNGITIRVYPNRVRISVPNCGDMELVMWVFCTSGRTEDPFTWEYFSFDFIRFVVMRGLNLDEESHGLIGQFWNVPVNVTENTGFFNGEMRDDDYIITVYYPGSPPRQFIGLGAFVTWEFEKRPCLYVGNSQAGPLGETVDPNDSVIEGTYKYYEVDSMFSSDFVFSHFDELQCT